MATTSEDPRRPPALLEWLPALLICAMAVVLLGGPASLHPTVLALGSPQSEAPAHLWASWATLSTFFDQPLILEVPAAYPEGLRQPVTNPANLLLALPIYLLAGSGPAGVVLGWNLLAVGAPVVAGLGLAWLGGLLHREATPWLRGAIRALGAVGGAFAVHWITFPWTGRGEFFTAALLPLLLGLIWLGLRPGGRPWLPVASGLLLGLMVLGGPYMGPFLALSLPASGLVLVAAARREGASWGRVLGVLGITAGLGFAVALPQAWLLSSTEWPGLVDSPSGAAPGLLADLTGALRLTAVASRVEDGTDLLVHVGGPVRSIAVPGVVGLALGLVGLARGRVGWLLATLWTWSLAFGPVLEVGQELSLLMPSWFLQQRLDLLEFVHNWSRIGCILAVPVSLAAMEGLRVLGAASWGRRGLVAVAVGLTWLDLVLVPGLPSQARPTVDIRPPEALVAAEPLVGEGAMMVLPVWGLPPPKARAAAEGGMPGPKAMPRQAHLWALAMDRGVTATVDTRGDALIAEALLARADVLSRSTSRQALPSPECVAQGAGELASLGVSALVVNLQGAPSPRLLALLEEGLGPPVAVDAQVSVWALLPRPTTEACPRVVLPREVEAAITRDEAGGELPSADGDAPGSLSSPD